MKKLFALAAVTCALLVGLAGCQRGTSTKGAGGQQFTAIVKDSHSVKQGDTEDISVGINRDNFNDAVTVKFDNLPEGVTVTNTEMKIPADEKAHTFTLKAAETAKVVTDHPVTVKMTGTGGAEKTHTLKLTVRSKS